LGLRKDFNVVFSNAMSGVTVVKPLATPFPFFAVITESRIVTALCDCHHKSATTTSEASHSIRSHRIKLLQRFGSIVMRGSVPGSLNANA
jgi:hypothetical protein